MSNNVIEYTLTFEYRAPTSAYAETTKTDAAVFIV